MKFVIQRVSQAKLLVEQQEIAAINKGFLVFIGISQEDSEAIADVMIRKLIGLRIFEDEQGKTNLSLADVAGELLLVSQFTLYADCKKGNRPSFTQAGAPQLAKELFDYVISRCRLQVDGVKTGVFGANMQISLTNQGPFTIILDSRDLV